MLRSMKHVGNRMSVKVLGNPAFLSKLLRLGNRMLFQYLTFNVPLVVISVCVEFTANVSCDL